MLLLNLHQDKTKLNLVNGGFFYLTILTFSLGIYIS